jgi:hypothetical protein
MIALYLASITMLHGQTLPEYTAAEAKKHIGETARVTDKVCEVSPRHWGGYHVGLGHCDPSEEFFAITYSDVIPGPKLDLEKLKGVVVTVTGRSKNTDTPAQRRSMSSPLRKLCRIAKQIRDS